MAVRSPRGATSHRSRACACPSSQTLRAAAHVALLEKGLQPISVTPRTSILRFEITKKRVPRKDIMNFFPYDPIAGHGLDDGTPRQNPLVVAVRFRDVISPAHYPSFRWKFFRVHFQFLMANERPALFDYFMIIAGPLSLEARFCDQKAAAMAAGRDTPAQQQTGTKAAPVRSS